MIIFSKILVVIFISHEPIKNYSRHGISTSFTRKSINNSTYRCENKTWFTLYQFNHNRMVFQIRFGILLHYQTKHQNFFDSLILVIQAIAVQCSAFKSGRAQAAKITLDPLYLKKLGIKPYFYFTLRQKLFVSQVITQSTTKCDKYIFLTRLYFQQKITSVCITGCVI